MAQAAHHAPSPADLPEEVLARAWTTHFHQYLARHEMGGGPAPTAGVVMEWEIVFRHLDVAAIQALAEAEPQRAPPGGGRPAERRAAPGMMPVGRGTLGSLVAFGWLIGIGLLMTDQQSLRLPGLGFLLAVGILMPAALVIIPRIMLRRRRDSSRDTA